MLDNFETLGIRHIGLQSGVCSGTKGTALMEWSRI